MTIKMITLIHYEGADYTGSSPIFPGAAVKTDSYIIDFLKAGGTVTADFSVNPESPVGYADPDGTHFQASHPVNVRNNGARDADYHFPAKSAGGAEILGWLLAASGYTKRLKDIWRNYKSSVNFVNPQDLGWNPSGFPL
ncbi:hypothetical protein GGS23DRAFT_601374 [Durotheca rogersii]|uniref:uncharacterized protein n=1 Tax=Durotheca rogersii TaxID=419775 RepID=UPI00221E391A|nr:uncharacterized protein GGS23DRAFT_601374 [Durotheca rogersii]KAI5855543.1 hypothetical protein GGS23DRAFT_601374 [Durotheca rogersii]